MDAMWSMNAPIWVFILRAVLVYVVILFLLRLSGKRQIGQMGAAEFVSILLISNAVQNSMNGGDNSIVAGVVMAVVLMMIARVFQIGSYRSRKLMYFIQGRPRLLMHNGEVLKENLKAELLTIQDLKRLLRRQGVPHLHDVHQAVLESDGSLSIIRHEDTPDERVVGPVRDDFFKD
jgi:uncharacterized membrane protein YcaP (DUF421 family)